MPFGGSGATGMVDNGYNPSTTNGNADLQHQTPVPPSVRRRRSSADAEASYGGPPSSPTLATTGISEWTEPPLFQHAVRSDVPLPNGTRYFFQKWRTGARVTSQPKPRGMYDHSLRAYEAFLSLRTVRFPGAAYGLSITHMLAAEDGELAAHSNWDMQKHMASSRMGSASPPPRLGGVWLLLRTAHSDGYAGKTCQLIDAFAHLASSTGPQKNRPPLASQIRMSIATNEDASAVERTYSLPEARHSGAVLVFISASSGPHRRRRVVHAMEYDKIPFDSTTTRGRATRSTTLEGTLLRIQIGLLHLGRSAGRYAPAAALAHDPNDLPKADALRSSLVHVGEAFSALFARPPSFSDPACVRLYNSTGPTTIPLEFAGVYVRLTNRRSMHDSAIARGSAREGSARFSITDDEREDDEDYADTEAHLVEQAELEGQLRNEATYACHPSAFPGVIICARGHAANVRKKLLADVDANGWRIRNTSATHRLSDETQAHILAIRVHPFHIRAYLSTYSGFGVAGAPCKYESVHCTGLSVMPLCGGETSLFCVQPCSADSFVPSDHVVFDAAQVQVGQLTAAIQSLGSGKGCVISRQAVRLSTPHVESVADDQPVTTSEGTSPDPVSLNSSTAGLASLAEEMQIEEYSGMVTLYSTAYANGETHESNTPQLPAVGDLTLGELAWQTNRALQQCTGQGLPIEPSSPRMSTVEAQSLALLAPFLRYAVTRCGPAASTERTITHLQRELDRVALARASDIEIPLLPHPPLLHDSADVERVMNCVCIAKPSLRKRSRNDVALDAGSCESSHPWSLTTRTPTSTTALVQRVLASLGRELGPTTVSIDGGPPSAIFQFFANELTRRPHTQVVVMGASDLENAQEVVRSAVAVTTSTSFSDIRSPWGDTDAALMYALIKLMFSVPGAEAGCGHALVLQVPAKGHIRLWHGTSDKSESSPPHVFEVEPADVFTLDRVVGGELVPMVCVRNERCAPGLGKDNLNIRVCT
jgi:hypothetical protein